MRYQPRAAHIWRAGWLSAKLLEPCRTIARAHGYAIAEHGSKERDIDWIAAPWVDDPGSPQVLAYALLDRIAALNDNMAYFHPHSAWDLEGAPGLKPQGRLTWCIHLGSGLYIDLSVVPPSKG